MQLEAYNSLYKHDFICLSETYVDSSTHFNDNSFQIEGYILVRADYLNDVKIGGVCIYYRESLTVTVIVYRI